MHDLTALIRHHEIGLVFVAVLIEGIGLPVPSYPVVIVAAALLTEANGSIASVVAAAFAAGVLCDVGWFWAGRRLGFRLLRGLCKISLSADSCVKKTEALFLRWGAPSLLVARLVPGFSIVAQPLAGALGQRFAQFLVYDVGGLFLWVASATVLGVLFSSAVDDVLDLVSRFGSVGTTVLVALLVAYVAYRWYRRYAFIRQLRMERITVQDLRTLIDAGLAPIILDVRSDAARSRDGAIPASILVASADEVAPATIEAAEVIVYCACPNEASAALLARQLLNLGARRVRPLLGGIDAWIAAGFAIETIGADAARSETNDSETPCTIIS
jgi:membrane protein DedA with SNARE-associated domain/rhodanese-related sulfurtransferase